MRPAIDSTPSQDDTFTTIVNATPDGSFTRRRPSVNGGIKQRRPSFSSLFLTQDFGSETTSQAAREYEQTLDQMTKYDSYNFHIEDSKVHLDMRVLLTRSRCFKILHMGTVFALTISIGFTLAFLSVFMSAAETALYYAIKDATKRAMCSGDDDVWRCIFMSYVANVGLRLSLVVIACSLTLWQPYAAGSGMSHVKSNLNGTDIPGYLSVRTLFAKVVGIVCVVSTALPLDKDGPMIHVGAMVSTCLSRLAERIGGSRLGLTMPAAQRNWVSMGAAAGVAAAFNAPLGGILYSFEEVTSHWSETLTWRAFLCSLFVAVSAAGLREALACHDDSYRCSSFASHDFITSIWDHDDHGGGASDSHPIFTFSDGNVFWFVFLSACMGLLGAAYNRLVGTVNWHRQRWHQGHQSRRLLEVIVLATLTFSALFCLPFAFDCSPCPAGSSCANTSSTQTGIHHYEDAHGSLDLIQHHCPTHHYSPMATLTLASQHGLLQHLYVRDGSPALRPAVLATLLVVYFVLAVLTLGVALPGGGFVPGMILGALGGRLLAETLGEDYLHAADRGAFALVGSAAMLGGMTRMTITLTVILVEVTGDVHLMPAMMLALSVAAAVAGPLAKPLDNIFMELNRLPFLPEVPPKKMQSLAARDVMTPRVVTLTDKCLVADIVQVLEHTPHNGFPVVHSQSASLCGIIVRRQLAVLLYARVWEAMRNPSKLDSNLRAMYVSANSRWHEIKDMELRLSEKDQQEVVDLSSFMDQNPPLLTPTTPLPFVYHLFNDLGVRHLPIVDSKLRVVGIITRKDTFQELIEKRISTHTASRGSTPRATDFSSTPDEGTTPRADSITDPNTSKLFLRLTYASSLAARSARVADNQLANIMEAALRNNPSMGIGGMLHFNTETLSLIQVLEGPEMNVRALYNKIAADSRHVGCEILHERWAPTRMYKTWGMSLGKHDVFVPLVSGLQGRSDSKREQVGVLKKGLSPDSSPQIDPSTPVLRLQYSSTLVAQYGEKHVQKLLSGIVKVAVRRNPQQGIGGVLLFDPTNNRVRQTIEGPQQRVDELYTKILNDTRHEDIVLIEREVYTDRMFQGWGMQQGSSAKWESSGAKAAACMETSSNAVVKHIRRRLDEFEPIKGDGGQQVKPYGHTVAERRISRPSAPSILMASRHRRPSAPDILMRGESLSRLVAPLSAPPLPVPTKKSRRPSFTLPDEESVRVLELPVAESGVLRSSPAANSGSLTLNLKSASNLMSKGKADEADIFCVVVLLGEEVQTSAAVKQSSPTWDQKFTVSTHSLEELCAASASLKISVFSEDGTSKHSLGDVEISPHKFNALEPGQVMEFINYPLDNAKAGQLSFSLCFEPSSLLLTA